MAGIEKQDLNYSRTLGAIQALIQDIEISLEKSISPNSDEDISIQTAMFALFGLVELLQNEKLKALWIPNRISTNIGYSGEHLTKIKSWILTTRAELKLAPTRSPVNNTQGRILIVDDEPDITEILREILTSAAFEVIDTTDSSKVEKLILDHDPEVLFSDLAMPKPDGMEILSMCTRRFPDLPVIFVSGHIDRTSLISAIDKRIYGVIEKPFTPKQVVNAATTSVYFKQTLNRAKRVTVCMSALTQAMVSFPQYVNNPLLVSGIQKTIHEYFNHRHSIDEILRKNKSTLKEVS